MAALLAMVRRHPALTYFALVFTISWGGILLAVGRQGVPATPEQVATLMPIALVALFAGPSIASLVCTGLVHGRPGYRELIARGLVWRVGARAYAVALLTAPLLVITVLFGLSQISTEFLPGILTADDKLGLLLFGAAWGFAGGGLLEELGWTGFAVPELRRRHGPFATGLIVGFLWGAWHYLITFWASGTSTGALSWAGFVPAMVFYIASLPAYRVLMVWLYDATQSLLLAMLMHASFSASMLVLQPPSTSLGAGLTWNVALAALLWVVVGAAGQARRVGVPRPPPHDLSRLHLR